MRDYNDIVNMAAQDYSIGLTAHYKPLAELIEDRGYKSMIEIGTAYAGNAFHLLSTTNIEKLICVDPYKFYPAMPGFTCQDEYDTLFRYAKDRLVGLNVEFIKETSKRAFEILQATQFLEKYKSNPKIPVDIIFLDGSHDYADVKWECESYSRLVKHGGVLAGHDYDIFEGVNKAVNEFSNHVHLLPGNIWYINF